MGWGRGILLGALGSFDTDEYRRRVGAARSAASRVGKETAQDEQIAALRQENHELKLYMAGLLQLLVGKGTLAREEVEELVTLVERAEEDAKRAGPRETSEDLEAIAAAVRGKSPEGKFE